MYLSWHLWRRKTTNEEPWIHRIQAVFHYSLDNLWFKALMCCVQNMDIKYECECVVTKFIVSLISISTASLLQVWSRKFWKKNSDVSYDVKLRLKHVIRSQMMWLRFLPLTMFRLQYWQYMCGDQWWIKLQLVFILKCISKLCV